MTAIPWWVQALIVASWCIAALAAGVAASYAVGTVRHVVAARRRREDSRASR